MDKSVKEIKEVKKKLRKIFDLLEEVDNFFGKADILIKINDKELVFLTYLPIEITSFARQWLEWLYWALMEMEKGGAKEILKETKNESNRE